MVLPPTTDRFDASRGDRVTYILREPEQHHRFGISSLALGSTELFTGGRDGTIRAWTLPHIQNLSNSSHDSAQPSSINPISLTESANSSTDSRTDSCASSNSAPSPKCTKTFDEHVDWVNDVLYIGAHDRLISCSSDTTVKVWHANDPSRSLRTLIQHSDYVKALAPVLNGVASGSLDGRVIIWDLVMGNVRAECGIDVHDAQIPNGSIYCMCASVPSNILVSGSTDRTISVWDVRTSDRAVHLRGHSDSVRCLTMKNDGYYMLSGATDATVKLWDLRMERCVRTFESFAGSVWAITANESFNSFVAGGRDGSVWHTDINEQSATVFVPVADPDPRSNMVLDVALSSCNSAVWVSTTGSTVRLWPIPAEVRAQMDNKSDSFGTGNASNGPGPQSSLDGKTVPVQHKSFASPLYVIPGLPGIIAQHVMNDRRHVLTCDTRGEYKIWDITRGCALKSFGILEGAKFEDLLREHDTEVAVPSWLHVDIRLGSLLVRLEKSTVANAEIYAVDAGLDAPTEDIKVNIGEHVVIGLFSKWLEKYKELEEKGETLEARGETLETVPTSQTLQKGLLNRSAELPQYDFPKHIPVVISKASSPVPILRRTVGTFDGREVSKLPEWVVSLVRDGIAQFREVVKIGFTLEPVEGSKLPNLSSMTLNAPKVLRVRKILSYILKELKDPSGSDLNLDENRIEILCNGRVLSPMMSLAAVRQFRWRSPDDLKLYYRLKSLSSP